MNTLRNLSRGERGLMRPQVLLILALVASAIFLFQASEGGPPIVEAAVNVDLDQWANEDLAWQNGNLNGNNSVYAEDLVVPFRYAVEGLTPGDHTFHINYDFTAGGHLAYDFLATYTATEAVTGNICDVGGGAVSSMCPSLPSPDTEPFPSDATEVDSLPVSGAETASGYSRNLTLWGGTITSITGPTHDGDTDGNSTGDFVVTFNVPESAPGCVPDEAVDDCRVLFAWGGHLASSEYWTPPIEDGAGQISGAPWHMRTLNFDGGGASNQDRSIQPSALAQATPGSITIIKQTTPDGSLQSFNFEASYDADGFSLTDGASDTASELAPADYDVTESIPDNWTLDSIDCGDATTVDILDGATLVGVTITLGEAEDVTCTFNNSQLPPDLVVVKTPDGDTITAGDEASFTVQVTNNGPGVASNVTLSDTLPGTGWVEDPENADCSIASGNELSCSFGDLADDASASVTVSRTTSADDCGTLNNTGVADADNDDEASDTGSIIVQCPDITVTKTADNTPITAGDVASFTITVTNDGPGTATNVTLTDTLPNGGLVWTDDHADCSVAFGVLSCSFGDMADGAFEGHRHGHHRRR